MSTTVQSPVAGVVEALSSVSDPVFSAEMVGSGLAVRPDPGPGTALAPVSGTLVKAMPHAYVITGDDGAVLVHLGLDTVKLQGDGFEVLVTQGDHVGAGAEVVRWDPTQVAERGLDAVVLVCALDTPPQLVSSDSAGRHVDAGAPLFELPLS